MRARLNAGVLTAALLCSSAASAAPAERPKWEPSVCNGLRSPKGSPPMWGMISVGELRSVDNCPPGAALINAEPTGGRYGIPERVPVMGACCELPPDALTSEKLLALETCPEGYVATGVQVLESKEKEWWAVPKALICTKINAERYLLGEPKLAIRVSPARELGDVPFLRQIIGEYTLFATTSGRIPAGIRYAIGRVSGRRWSADTCTGFPWGSLLVAKTPRGCNFSFRELQYRGLSGDPARGTGVKLFPDCDYLDDPLSTAPNCIKHPGGVP